MDLGKFKGSEKAIGGFLKILLFIGLGAAGASFANFQSGFCGDPIPGAVQGSVPVVAPSPTPAGK